MNWESLTYKQKSDLMRIYLQNGIFSLDAMKEHYNSFADEGSLGKVTPYGQWQYPHQVTTIPSNNITMKGVNYPVLGISNTGDAKLMQPNEDYKFNGSYVIEYPFGHIAQNGRYIGTPKLEDPIYITPNSVQDNTSVYRQTVQPYQPNASITETDELERQKKEYSDQQEKERIKQQRSIALGFSIAGDIVGRVSPAAGLLAQVPEIYMDWRYPDKPLVNTVLNASSMSQISGLNKPIYAKLNHMPKIGKYIGPAYSILHHTGHLIDLDQDISEFEINLGGKKIDSQYTQANK